MDKEDLMDNQSRTEQLPHTICTTYTVLRCSDWGYRDGKGLTLMSWESFLRGDSTVV